jgi:hypothetical protein
MSHPRTGFAVVVLALLSIAAPSYAQTIGTFRWQLQPYCNVLTLTVTQQGSNYTLDGTDDRCGGGNQPGSAVGLAYLTPLGLIGFGITSVLPNGTPLHIESTISFTNLSGTWRDSAGNSGTLVFTAGAPVAGAPRPTPSGGIAPASITNVQIANNAVMGANIAPASITNAHIANNAVTGANILNGSVTIAELADPPRAAFADGDQSVTLTFADVVVRTVSMTAPAAGRVIVNASGYFVFDFTTFDSARCSITTGTTIEFTGFIPAAEATEMGMAILPFAGTRGFAVPAGAHTFNLVCNLFSGTARVENTSLTATFTPGP